MKKVLITFLFIFVGVLFGAGAMFAITKLNESKAPVVETDNDSEDNEVGDEEELDTVERGELVTYAEGYYSVYSQKCGMTFPFPESDTFKYLEDLGAPAAVGDKNKGWYLSDSAAAAGYTSFGNAFEHQIMINMTALPYTDHLGSGYTSANIVINCKEDANTTLDELMEEFDDMVIEINDNAAFLLSIDDVQNTTLSGKDAISFMLNGGMVDLEYIITRNDTHIYMLSSFVGSPDTKIQEAAEYMVENISI